MKQFISIFKKVGGWQVLKDWLRGRVFLYAMLQTLLSGLSRKGLELVRLGVEHKLYRRLRRKNAAFIRSFTEQTVPAERKRSDKVWVCWLQGMDNAPALVQRCWRSLQENLQDRELVLLTQENYRDYVTFPPHIQQKIDSGVITRTHFSDLLRLELLLNHGGTWIDATVFCSGGQIPGYMLNSDLFLFQTLKPGLDGHTTCISSWFMTACANHPILALTRALLYRYWETHNKMVDYFLIHLFFQMAIEAYPAEWDKAVPFSNETPHILLLRLFEAYDEDCYRAVCGQTPFHKLSYKFDPAQTQLPDTYYKHVMENEVSRTGG